MVNTNYVKSSYTKSIREWLGPDLKCTSFGISPSVARVCQNITVYYELNYYGCYSPDTFKKILDMFKWHMSIDLFHDALARYILWELYNSPNHNPLWIELNRIKDKVRRFHFDDVVSNVLHSHGDVIEYLIGFPIDQLLTILA